MLDDIARTWSSQNGGENIWANKQVRFLDPCTKTGVFLREITSRLVAGLEDEMPDLHERVDHILKRQVFGIGLTKQTGMLARRSIYCSKDANGVHSIARGFKTSDGNIWYSRGRHKWEDDRCSYCGASKSTLDRGEGRELHAYEFIHTKDVEADLQRMFGDEMQFDVIIGNPPYQLSDASDSASASPIYNKFVDQAIALEPRIVSMVTPSRWFVGGKGLDDFRERMLSDRRMRVLVDYIVDKDAFPKINLNGGISYFVWDRNYLGPCSVTTIERGGIASEPVSRALNEFDVFIRRSEATTILRKVLVYKDKSFAERVYPRKPFGLPTNFFGQASQTKNATIKLHCSGKVTWVKRDQIPARTELIEKWKVLIGRATDGNENYPLPIWDKRGPFVVGPEEACTETYLVAAVSENEQTAKRIAAYMATKFFRFLVSLRKITQDNKAEVFGFVPDLPMTRNWTDEALAKRYDLSREDIAFIDNMIRDVEFSQ